MRAVLTRGYQVGCTSPADARQTFMWWSFCYTIISGFSLECESSECNCSLHVIHVTLLSCHLAKSSKSPVIFFSVSAARAVILRLPVTEKHHGHPEAWWPWPRPGWPSGDLPGGAVWGGVWGEERGRDHLQAVWGQDHQGLPDLQDHGTVHQPRTSGRSGPPSQNCTWVLCRCMGTYPKNCTWVLCRCISTQALTLKTVCGCCVGTSVHESLPSKLYVGVV